MSVNLIEAMNAEQMVTTNRVVRRCSYCHSQDHIISRCRRARSESFNIHMGIISSMRLTGSVNNNMLNYLRFKMNNCTVIELNLLLRINNVDTNSEYLCRLEEEGKIALGTRLVRLKCDKVEILSWIYLDIYENELETNNVNINRLTNRQTRKWKLDVKLVEEVQKEEEDKFDCPICMEKTENKKKVTSNCRHGLCKCCVMNYFDHLSKQLQMIKPTCSLCRADMECLSFVSIEYKDELTKKYVI